MIASDETRRSWLMGIVPDLVKRNELCGKSRCCCRRILLIQIGSGGSWRTAMLLKMWRWSHCRRQWSKGRVSRSRRWLVLRLLLLLGLLLLLLLLLLLKVMLWCGLAQDEILARGLLVRTMRMPRRVRQSLMMQQFLLLLLMLLLQGCKVAIRLTAGLRQLLLNGFRQRSRRTVCAHFGPICGIHIVHGLALQIQADAARRYVLLVGSHLGRVAMLLLLRLLCVLLQMFL